MQLLFGFLFCSLVVLTYAQNKKLLLQKPSNDDSEILLIITWTNDPQQIEHCEIYSDEAVQYKK
uniref:U37-Eretoxin-Ek1k_1 n=1 Tax=Eresus cinnaberinus TaxID=175337 RepID=A0A2D0PC46_ERECI